MDSVVRYKYPGRRTVLARLRSTAAGSGMGSHSVVAEWNDVVPIPLELWLARYDASAADSIASAVDCRAAAKHIRGHRDSRDIQRCRLYSRHKRSG